MKDKETVKNWIFLADGDLKTAEDELMSKKTTIEEAEESIKIAKNVKKFVLQKIRKHKIMQKE